VNGRYGDGWIADEQIYPTVKWVVANLLMGQGRITTARFGQDVALINLGPERRHES
jgi:hypothetical protein